MTDNMSLLRRSKYLHLFYDRSGMPVFWDSLRLRVFNGTKEDIEIWNRFSEPQAMIETSQEEQWAENKFLLSSSTETRPLSLLSYLRLQAWQRRNGRISIMRLAVTDKCNLKCEGCFHQSFHLAPKDMDIGVFTDTLKWFLKLNKGCSPQVQYFGGEPLIRMDLIKLGTRLVEDALKTGVVQGIHQEITTNGTLLNPADAEYLKEHGVNLTFSLDGTKEMNDEFRRFSTDRGSYEQVLKGIDAWRSVGGDVTLLITPRRQTVGSLPLFIGDLINETGATSINMNAPQPIGSAWEVPGLALASCVQKMWDICLESGVKFAGPGTHLPLLIGGQLPQIDRCLDNAPCSKTSEWPIFVSTDGMLSPCLVYHYDPRCVFPRDDAETMVRLWHQDSSSQPECDRCPAALVCGGMCTLETLLANGRLNDDRCQFYKAMLEWTLIR